MNRFEKLQVITQSGVVAILRSPAGDTLEIGRSLVEGGVRAIEITADTPGVFDAIGSLRKWLPEAVVGVGTVLDPETARLAIMAGAQFLVTPTLFQATIEMATRYDTLIVPGVFTPTEIFQAFQWGAPAVKVFPAITLGPDYIRHVKAPLASVPLIPTGGVDLTNVAAFIKAGASAVGLGSTLVRRADAESGDYAAITAQARAFVSAIDVARRSV